jgi:hypothetical protein
MSLTGLPPTLDHRLEADPTRARSDESSVTRFRASSRKRVESLTSRCERANRDLSAKVGDSCLPSVAHSSDRARRRPSHDDHAVARPQLFA